MTSVDDEFDPLANDADEADGAAAPQRRGGRPRKTDAPKYPVEEVDRLLVFGEPAVHEHTGLPTTRYPSIRELAKRFGVSHSVIALYAARHNCARRRQEIEERSRTKAEQKLVNLRADRIAMSKDDAIAILDEFILNFAEALKAGRVRCDSLVDVNTALRLKAFLLGGADQRQELMGGVSLEHLQTLHKDYQKQRTAETTAARGEIARPSTPKKDDAASPSVVPLRQAGDLRLRGRRLEATMPEVGEGRPECLRKASLLSKGSREAEQRGPAWARTDDDSDLQNPRP